MVTLIKTLQVILALSLLVFIHELGHFLWAKIFGIRVEKFYIFFDVKGHAIVRWHWKGTEFGIGWIPFGGYCKISGMVDESMDLEQLRAEPKPWEFRTHPAWQRLLVMAGGVLNNFIFAVLAYIAIMGIWGQAYISNHGTKLWVSEIGMEMGFRNGDEILSLDDYVPEDFTMLQADLARKNVSMASVLRDNDTIQLYIDHGMIGEILNAPMFDIALPFIIDSTINADSGIKRGDRVIAFDGEPVTYMQDAQKLLAGKKGCQSIASVVRGADTLSIPVKVDSAGHIGVLLKSPAIERRNYDFWSAIPAGIKYTGKTINGYIQDLGLLVRPSTKAYQSVGSFIAIGQVFPSSWNWYQFLSIVALLSIMLGVMNLIPIPGLDGGHILFTLYEIVTGRKPSDRFLYIMQIIGMILLVALMLLAFGNDIGRLIK